MTTLIRRRRPNQTAPRSTPPEPSQDDKRVRRRGGMSVAYGSDFSLTGEIAAICHPLAIAAAAVSNRRSVRSAIADLADAVHELVSTVVGWLATADAQHRVDAVPHLDSAEKKQAVQHLVDLTPRPVLPEIGADEIKSGHWGAELVDMAKLYDVPLAELLGRSLPSAHPDLRGLDSRSDRLVELLRDVDTAARDLTGRIDKASAATTRPPAPTREDAAREALREMGIEP